ncbi:MAG: hypothetical protein K0Q50_957 [Vampirovibrio sp.]|nr:hypothetical protein [Vampirovibrio sp.]
MNPPTNPVVTFLVPCGENEQFLLTCVQSLLMQTFIDFEVLLLDEGKSPAVSALAAQLPPADGRIRYVPVENTDPTEQSTGWGITHANGDLIWRIAAEHCLASPHVLQDFVTQFILNSRLGMAFCRVQCLDEGNAPYETYIPHKKDSNLPYQPTLYPGQLFFRHLLKENILPSPAVIVRKACFIQTGLENEDVFEWEAWLCFALEWDVYFDPEPKVYYRQDRGRHAGVKSPDELERILFCYRAVEAYLANHRYPKPLKRQAQLARLQFMRRKGFKMSLPEKMMRLYRRFTAEPFDFAEV